MAYRILFVLLIWCLYGLWAQGVPGEVLLFLGVLGLGLFCIALYCPMEAVHTIIYRPSGWTLLFDKKARRFHRAELLCSLGWWVVLRFKRAGRARNVIIFCDALDENQLKKMLVLIQLSDIKEIA